MYTQIFLIMLIDFTEHELETIANAMEDYILYDDEKLILIYYLVVYQLKKMFINTNKIDTLFCKIRG